ncbi:MAG: Hsp33 family molecular chaperone HslO [Pseudomonadota bacterium]
MTSAAQIAWDDMILPFQLDRSDIRGRVARLDRALEQMLAQHAYPAPVSALVAEATLLTALIGEAIKLRWKLSLQVRGDGPIRLIATDYFSPEKPGEAARIRAYASFDEARVPAFSADPHDLLGKGFFGLVIDQGSGTKPYQGITPLAGGSLAAAAEIYFAQSEQIATRFALAAAEAEMPGDRARWRGGGVMLQKLPESPPRLDGDGGSGEAGLLAAADMLDGDHAEDWERTTTLLSSVEMHELLGPHVAPDRLLIRLFHEEVPRVFDTQAIAFGCTCSPEKVRQSLSIYSARDIAHMTTEDGIVTADCQFCGAHYEFDPKTLGFEAEREE